MPNRPRGRLLLVAITAVALVVLTLVPGRPASLAAAGSPALTPPLGWNDWNSFGCDVNETVIRQAADAMVNSGMSAAGYQYVVVDDCWFDPNRDAQGNLRSSPTKFPAA
jgi:alpha-galactosidase